MRKIVRNSITFVQILCQMKSRHFLIPLAACLFFISCSGSHYETFSGYAQGGTYSVKANIAGVKVPKKEIASTIDSLLQGIDFSLSGYNHNSLLSRYNAGEDIVQDRYFKEVLALSEKYNVMTNGTFDVKCAPLFDIWGFGFTDETSPSPQKVAEAMEKCKKGKTLNFNAIAQGYTSDVIAGYLHSIGVKDMLVDIGEIFCEGVNPEGKNWSIGVDKPEDGNNTPGAKIDGIWESDGSPCGIVTSGNYRKFYIKDGKKYAHTIDPRTGYPVQHNLLSATIVAPTAAEADAIATACMVMGTEEAEKFIESHSELEGYLITSEGTWTSRGFRLR